MNEYIKAEIFKTSEKCRLIYERQGHLMTYDF